MSSLALPITTHDASPVHGVLSAPILPKDTFTVFVNKSGDPTNLLMCDAHVGTKAGAIRRCRNFIRNNQNLVYGD